MVSLVSTPADEVIEKSRVELDISASPAALPSGLQQSFLRHFLLPLGFLENGELTLSSSSSVRENGEPTLSSSSSVRENGEPTPLASGDCFDQNGEQASPASSQNGELL